MRDFSSAEKDAATMLFQKRLTLCVAARHRRQEGRRSLAEHGGSPQQRGTGTITPRAR